MLRVFTSFSGYDSQCLALDRLGIEYELVGWSEIDKYAIQAHNALFPQWADRNFGDISKIDWHQVPDFDLFTYSSPCQDFSQAGKQMGGEQGSGTRSSLLWECLRAIEAKKPQYLLMENVAALVSNKFIRTFNQWQLTLDRMGYKNWAKVLNAKDYGVPQNRERIFLVSVLDREARYEFPKPRKLDKRLKDMLEPQVEEKYYLSDAAITRLTKETKWNKGRNIQDGHKIAGALIAKYSKNEGQANYLIDKSTCIVEPDIVASRGRDPQVMSPKRTEYGKAIRKKYENGEIKEQRKNIQQLEPRTDGMSNTLTGVQKDNYVAEPNYRIRNLTPRECFRLMGVGEPEIDTLTSCGISNSQLYKLAGNSIVVDVLEAIFDKMFVNKEITEWTLF